MSGGTLVLPPNATERKAALAVALEAEGVVFMGKYGHDAPGDTFGADITAAFNAMRPANNAWEEERVNRAFAVMHGYLNNAYLGGWWEPGMPEWAKTRQSSWQRWVLYLRTVDEMNPMQAASIAKHLFFAVDSVAPYS